MKKSTWISLGLVVVLSGLYLVLDEEPAQTVSTPGTIEKVEGLSRVVFERSGDEIQDVAFQKNDDTWRLQKPLEAPIADDVASKLDETFSEAIRTDDLTYSGQKAAEYGLSDDNAVRVQLFGEDTSEAAEVFLVGDEVTVGRTGVKRTYVQRPNSARIYRAQVSLGNFVRKDVASLRDKTIPVVQGDAVSSVAIERNDGTRLELKKTDTGEQEAKWTLANPDAPFAVEQSVAESLASTLGGLTATGFADDKSAADLGLESPTARITARAGDEAKTLLLGRVTSKADGDDRTTYYAKIDSEPYQYELRTPQGENLDVSLGDLRSKTPVKIDRSSISGIRFPGEDGVVLRNSGDSWQLTRPDPNNEPNQQKIETLVDSVAELRVDGFPDISPDEAGLARDVEQLVVDTDDGTKRWLLGDKVEGTEGDRYVKFGDGEDVYILAKRHVERLYPNASDLTMDSGKTNARGPNSLPLKPGKLTDEQRKNLKEIQKMRQRNQMTRGE